MRSRKQARAEKVATIAKGGEGGAGTRKKKILLPTIEVFLHNIFLLPSRMG